MVQIIVWPNFCKLPLCILVYILPTAQCPPLPEIANGVISYFPDNIPDYDVGTTATYMCEDGFSLSGDVTRDCQSDRTFSGMEPICSSIREFYLILILCIFTIHVYNFYSSYNYTVFHFQLYVLTCLLSLMEKSCTVLVACRDR